MEVIMEKKKILLSVNEKLYSLIKKNAEANEWSINREIVEMLYTAIEARTNYIKKVNARREALTNVTQHNNSARYFDEQEQRDYLDSFEENDPDAPVLRTKEDIKEYLNKLSEKK